MADRENTARRVKNVSHPPRRVRTAVFYLFNSCGTMRGTMKAGSTTVASVIYEHNRSFFYEKGSLTTTVLCSRRELKYEVDVQKFTKINR